MRWAALLLVVGCTACAPENTDPVDFAGILYPADNPNTEAGIALGRELFFDPLLSADTSISCASCHRPELGFSDGLERSVGLDGRIGSRNTPGLTNIGFYHRPLFWDGRATDLEGQALHPVGTEHEMGGSWATVVDRLRQEAGYRRQFRDVFGAKPIDATLVGRALAQYQRSLVSRNSKYDLVRRGQAAYTEAEALGHAIFFDLADRGGPYAGLPTGECAHCHTPPHFTDQRYANNGLDEASDLYDFPDPGRGAVTGNRYDNGRFRTPGLRNVGLTAPYMHDGRLPDLESVVEHYDSGGHYAENRSPNVRPLGLSQREKRALVAFLHTLTDKKFVDAAVIGSPRSIR